MRNLLPPRCEQASYSLFHRLSEAGVLPICDRFDIGFLAYSPLDGGWLTGKYRRGAEVEPSARQRLRPGGFDVNAPGNQAKVEAVEELARLADDVGVRLPHLNVAAILAHRTVSAVLIGGSTSSHIENHLAGQDVQLSDEVLDRIDSIVPPGSSLNVAADAAQPAALQNKQLHRSQRLSLPDPTANTEYFRTLVESHHGTAPSSGVS